MHRRSPPQLAAGSHLPRNAALKTADGTAENVTPDVQLIIGLHLPKQLQTHMRATAVCAKVCVCARAHGHTDRRTRRQTDPQTHGHTDKRARARAGRRAGRCPGCCRPWLRAPPAAPAALPVARFSYFLPIRDSSGYKPLSFRSRRVCASMVNVK